MHFDRLIAFLLTALVSVTLNAQSLLTATPPTVLVKQVELVNWLDDKLNLNLTFVVSNPNSLDIDITAIRYEMKINNVLIAKDYRDQMILLKANVDTVVTVPVVVNMVQLFSAVPDAILQNLLRYDLQGAVVIRDFPMHIPFERKGELPLLQQ